MTFFLNATKELTEDAKVPFTIGLINLKSSIDADYLDFESFP